MLPLNRSESAIFTSSCAHHTPCLFVFSWSLWRDSFRCHSWGPFRPNYRKCLSEDRISDHLHSSLNSCCHSQYLRSPEIIFVKRRPRTENICPKLGCAFIWVLLVFMASETREDAQRYFTTAADDGQMSMCSWSIGSFEEFQKKKNVLKMSRVQRHLNELKSWFYEGDICADASSGPNSWTRRPDFDVFTLLLPLILPLYFVSSAFTTRRPHNDDRVPLRSRNDGRRRFSASKTDRLRFALRRSLRPWRQNPGTLRSVVFLPFQLLATQTKFKQNSFHIKWQTQRVLAL